MPSPLRAESATTGTPLICGSIRSTSARNRDIAPGFALDQVPLVDRDDDRTPFPLDKIGNADVLFFKWRLRVDQNDHDFGETDGIERIGNGKLFELLFDPRTAAHSCRVVNAKMFSLPVEIDGDCIAGNAGFRAGQKPLLSDQPVDQR